MLSEPARPQIAASVPVLRDYGLAITQHFYSEMFGAHPELRSVFNMGNQANGTQQISLASALFAYAANMDNAEALAPVADRIAHKHASVGIKPAHYPIVARYLLGAIQHVLREAATPALLQAWDEAYWLLAGELIAAEARLYERAHTRAGELTELTVAELRRESDALLSVYLKTRDGASPGSFEPGQYVSVAVDLPGAEPRRQLRQYSLSDAPERDYWRLTIKLEPGTGATPPGRISNHLHDAVRVGDQLLVSPPFGTFTPPTTGEPPLVLLSAGVGITPMLSVLHSLPVNSAPVFFGHAVRGEAQLAFAKELEALSERLPALTIQTWREDRDGRMHLSPDTLQTFADAADVYMCGPLPFMREQWGTLVELGFSPQRLHREVFGPEALDHLL